MNKAIDAIFATPLTLLRFWTLAFETAQATGTVLARRGPIIDEAMRTPLKTDVREFKRMGAEKVTAFSRSGQSLTVDLLKFQQLGFDHWLDLLAIAWRGVPPRRGDYDRFSARAFKMMALASESGLGALEPVHATVTANARRLK